MSDYERPIGGYAALMAIFATLVAGFAFWLRSSGRQVRQRPSVEDLVLVTLATHKTSRLLAKDRVTSPIRAPFTDSDDEPGPGESPRGFGLRRAVGELVLCPHCLGLWIATAFGAGLIVAPRPTRWIASALAVAYGSDVLQIVYRRAES